MMYKVSYQGEAVVASAVDEEDAREQIGEFLSEVPMGDYEITNVKELD